MKADLTLEVAKKTIRQSEAVRAAAERNRPRVSKRSGTLVHKGAGTPVASTPATCREMLEIREAVQEAKQTTTVQDVGKQNTSLETDVQPSKR